MVLLQSDPASSLLLKFLPLGRHPLLQFTSGPGTRHASTIVNFLFFFLFPFAFFSWEFWWITLESLSSLYWLQINMWDSCLLCLCSVNCKLRQENIVFFELILFDKVKWSNIIDLYLHFSSFHMTWFSSVWASKRKELAIIMFVKLFLNHGRQSFGTTCD